MRFSSFVAVAALTFSDLASCEKKRYSGSIVGRANAIVSAEDNISKRGMFSTLALGKQVVTNFGSTVPDAVTKRQLTGAGGGQTTSTTNSQGGLAGALAAVQPAAAAGQQTPVPAAAVGGAATAKAGEAAFPKAVAESGQFSENLGIILDKNGNAVNVGGDLGITKGSDGSTSVGGKDGINVLSTASAAPQESTITLNGNPLTLDLAGNDITVVPEQNTATLNGNTITLDVAGSDINFVPKGTTSTTAKADPGLSINVPIKREVGITVNPVKPAAAPKLPSLPALPAVLPVAVLPAVPSLPATPPAAPAQLGRQ